jgi:hypothetical protein
MLTRRNALQTIAAVAALPALPADAESTGFTNDEAMVLKRLVDLIIPRTDTPGAADAGVDLLINANPVLREGIVKLGGKKFLALSLAEQNAALQQMADTPFFKMLKDRTIDLYYTTREGLAVELGYQGNVPLATFPGCTHPEHQKMDW